jgi:predicted deacylase
MKPSTPLVVTGGIHGDEPSGAHALEALARDGFTTFGPCNPWGLSHSRRTLADGRDLNRCFADPRCAEAERVRAFLREHPPAVLLDLHEDRGAAAPYRIQYGPRDELGARLVAHLAARHAFAPRPRFGPVFGRDGVLRPSAAVLALVGLSRRWPLVYWAWRTFRCTAIVVEAPGAWPLERRLAFHTDVARAARALAA